MMLKFVSFLFIFKTCISIGQTMDDHTVRIDTGRIRGSIHETIEQNRSYLAFRGIPYAKPPIGDLRFAEPQKVESWEEILDATEDKSQCIQSTNPVLGSEDCLYINVYTTNLRAKHAVMVWIHGGLFLIGNSSYQSFGPDYLLEQDIVFVSFNYRLGVLGFLSTGDTVIPGNWGLKDQILALEWVQKNIDKFGGDPTKVTIVGESAGAASVSYLIQSNRATGLFRSGIQESGSSHCLWSLSRTARNLAINTARKLKINTSNSSLILKELRKVDVQQLHETSLAIAAKITIMNALAGFPLVPVREPEHPGAVFHGRSYEQLQNGNFQKVPVLLGVNSNELAALGQLPLLLREFLILNYDLKGTILVPADLTSNLLDKQIAGSLIKFRYFGLLPEALQIDKVTRFAADDQFNRPVREEVLQLAKYSPTYYYVFSHQGQLGSANRTYSGVGHQEELNYLFRTYPTIEVSQTDSLVRKRMVKLWTNFIKYSNPTPEDDLLLQNQIWPQAKPDRRNLQYLDIGTNLEVSTNPFRESMEFYDYIYSTFGMPPYDTY